MHILNKIDGHCQVINKSLRIYMINYVLFSPVTIKYSSSRSDSDCLILNSLYVENTTEQEIRGYCSLKL